MRIYPAIDIRGGKCVRLRQGIFADMTIYNDDPVKVALGFKEAGAQYIHVVDLDGALDRRRYQDTRKYRDQTQCRSTESYHRYKGC